MLFGISNGLTCDFDSLTRLLPGTLVDHQTNPDDPPPSLQPHYRAFTATTRRSAPLPRIGTLPLTVSAAWGSPFRQPASTHQPAPSRRGVPTFRASARTELAPPSCRATARAVDRYPPGSSRGNNWTPVPIAVATLTTLQQWFTCVRLLRSTPDASRAPFPWCSSPRLIHRSNPRWFTASPCRAAVEGLPPSPAQHRNHQRDLLHRNLQPRSWRTIIGETHDDHVTARMPLPPPVSPQVQDVMQVHVGEQRR